MLAKSRRTRSSTTAANRWLGHCCLVLAVLACSRTVDAPAEQTIDVVGSDYAFQAPDSVFPGPTVFRFRSTGRVDHEMILVQLRQGATIEQLVAADGRDSLVDALRDGGVAVLFASPGQADDFVISVNLEPGRDYVLWCKFKDGEQQPAHASLGMFKRIRVVSSPGDQPPVPAVAEVVVHANDYAFVVTDTVPPGATNLRLINDGRQAHELSIAALRPGVTPQRAWDAFRTNANVDSLFLPGGAVLTAKRDQPNTFALRTTLESGRTYFVICEFQDAPDQPPHVMLGMLKALVVR